MLHYLVSDNQHPIIAVIYPLLLAVGYWVYRHWRFDLLMLAGGCLSCIAVIQTLLVKALGGSDAGLFLLHALLLLGQASIASIWLKHVQKGQTP
ncbi:hypothetical protein KO507_18815 [Gilvimarinus agarilyticus]|uniref:hypothetical protein n=1 Tax=Gilvimarinus sp. 2_MG-2023 TaxID=3062666 RepID=UPI001C087B19|nr:hypothetical protein [Gilvimarinus sp. 2_MG-2023]MBU2887823.1 hypothetical protein [Gilvimarinus agarilyticus]MDO6572461.1 hypothetical protein [Gilvimarinus sp. 2_MG-2023]